MVSLPIRIRFRLWVQRLRQWHNRPDPLDSVDEIPTVGDYIERRGMDARLPDSWCVDREMVRFDGQSLAEVVRFTSRGDGYRITLKPVDLQAPTEAIELYTRSSPFEARHYRETVDSLSAAVEAAERLAAARDRRVQQSTGRRRRVVDR
jgi:hypothetical protein